MRKILKAGIIFSLCSLMCTAAFSQVQQTIASQNFNGLSANNTSTTDMIASGMALTNLGAFSTSGSGINFKSYWIDTRGVTTGPVTVMFDTQDFIGVNAFAGANAPNVSPANVPYNSGTEHNFEFNDIDGRLELRFSPINLSDFNQIQFSLDYWINDTGYESEDAFQIQVWDGSKMITVLNLLEADLEGMSPGDAGDASEWNSFSINLSNIIASNNLNSQSVSIVVTSDTNAGVENIFIDNLLITGISTITPIPTLSQWGLLILGLLIMNLSLIVIFQIQSVKVK